MAEPTKKLQPADKSTYFKQHANKQAPAFVSPKGQASGKRKNIKGPAPNADGSQPASAQGDYLLKQQQGYEKE
jgi:hypothetical protein